MSKEKKSKKVNPWVKPRVKKAEEKSSPARYIIEVRPDTREQVISQLEEITDVSIVKKSADRYIVLVAPSEAIAIIEDIPEVVKISADTLAWIKDMSLFSGEIDDPWIGTTRLSSIEIECGPLDVPGTLLMKILGDTEESIYTTDYTRRYLNIPEDNTITTRVAVLDTGLLWPHLLMKKMVHLNSFTGEPPLDGQGHGTWCSTCAFGDKASHPAYGPCSGIADPTEQMHGKVLSNAGFGMTSWILDGMYYAVKEYGAKVVSMSLGGPLQGSAIDDDPMCRLIASLKDEAIFVVAAGNSGPDEWSIGSPGAAPDALTIASWGIIRNDIAGFSSRGPSGEYYKDNRDVWEQDKEAAGKNIVKPDCACPGGDDGEKLLSGCAGWYDPVADLVPQFGTMRGTSMATPHAAGIIALAYDRGLVRTADDVRRRIKTSYKSIHSGYGLLSWDRLFG